VSALDDSIDELYGLPLADFTAARNALAKTLKGDEAAAVKRLEKPSVVAWSVNQLYWRERRAFDKLMASGRALRTAQISALKGRSTDLREATSNHRTALTAALTATTAIAKQSGASPSPEPLTRMLEALSLAPALPAQPGRFTEQLQPAGFEALAGITPSAAPHIVRPDAARGVDQSARGGKKTAPPDEGEDARRRAKAEAERRTAAEAAVQQARRAVDQAQAGETRAQAQVDAARQQLERAESSLKHARAVADSARREAARTESALKDLTAARPQRRG
jgi:hypothetical protein